MARVPTPVIGRRAALAGAGLLLAGGTAAQADAARVATPRQTEGPYYPVDWTGDADADLVQVVGEAARANGQVFHLQGRVLDLQGQPLAGTRIEIWQCDAQGVYRHPRDETGGRRREPGFQGRGGAMTDGAGAYRFRTIKPVPYPGRTPHIHVKVMAPQRSALITQMYVAGEPLNERDSLLGRIRDPRQRESLLVRLEPAERLEPGALTGTFDIVLG
jgi:protocatechuate 3,4-dioxygenase, beta subunit